MEGARPWGTARRGGVVGDDDEGPAAACANGWEAIHDALHFIFFS